MKVIMSLQGSKQELDRLCNHMGWKRTERSTRRFGWNGTEVSTEDGSVIGHIEVATSTKPCILEIEPRTAEAAAQITMGAFASGAIESLTRQNAG